MKEYVVTIDCNGLEKQVKIMDNSEKEAEIKAKVKYPNCGIIDCKEYLKS